MQTDMVWRLLTEQIEHGWDESLPKPAPNPDDLYGPTLIGAWAEDRLVGGAFVMPDSQDALCIEVTDDDNAITCCFPIDGVVPDACWAFHIVAQPKWMPLAVGQGTVKGTGAHDDGGGITPEWMYRAVVS